MSSAQAFGSILSLVPLAESVVKLTAVCMECFREAAYTKRLGLEKEVWPHASAQGVGGPKRWLLSPPHMSLPPGGGDRRGRQVSLRMPSVLLQEVFSPDCWDRGQRELPGAGAAWRGPGCQEALCPSASPTV